MCSISFFLASDIFASRDLSAGPEMGQGMGAEMGGGSMTCYDMSFLRRASPFGCLRTFFENR